MSRSADIALPYGSSPYTLRIPDELAGARVTVVEPPAVDSESAPLSTLLEAALDEPIGAPRLEDSVTPGSRVVAIVSDATRADPREAMLQALLARLPSDIELTIAVANGTHGPSDLSALGISDALWRRAAHVINHDAHDDRDLVTIGTTARGTPVKLHRCLVTADWVLATGRIKPHYFAGYGAGCKSIFPGLGANREIRINHRLKQEQGARPGVVDGNPCRADLEEAVALLPSRRFLLNIVLDNRGTCRSAVAGDIEAAFRVGARQCEPWYRVEAPRADVVIVSDELPVTASLYQASKLVATAAPLLSDGGAVIVAAACRDGVGPVDTVNRGIYEIGLAPRLPANHQVVLVSDLTAEQVAPSYCRWASSIEAALAERRPETITILPRAGSLLVDAATDRAHK